MSERGGGAQHPSHAHIVGGLWTCDALARVRIGRTPLQLRRVEGLSKTPADALSSSSRASSAAFADHTGQWSHRGDLMTVHVVAPRAAHAAGRGGAAQARHVTDACLTRYVRTRVKAVFG